MKKYIKKMIPKHRVGDILDDFRPGGGWSKHGVKRDIAKAKAGDIADKVKSKARDVKDAMTPSYKTKRTAKKVGAGAVGAAAGAGAAAIAGGVGYSIAEDRRIRKQHREQLEGLKKQNKKRDQKSKKKKKPGLLQKQGYY